MYLAGPLDGLDNDGTTWYDEFEEIRPDDIIGFMPGRAFIGAVDNPEGMDAANRAVIRVAVGVIANLSGPGRALGTIREIEFAKSLGKPVIVVGNVSASLMAYDLIQVPDLAGAVEYMANDAKAPRDSRKPPTPDRR